jgi:hypothetical protein
VSPLKKALLLVCLSAAIVAVVLAAKKNPDPRSEPARRAPVADRPATTRVFYGRKDGVDYVLRRRRSSKREAEFADAELARALSGGPAPNGGPKPLCIVELWVLRRFGNPEASVVVKPPVLTFEGGRRVAALPLRDAFQSAERPIAATLLAALAPPEGSPLPIGALRRCAYALPRDVAFDDAIGASADGVDLVSGEARAATLDAWPEDATPTLEDLTAPLSPRRVAHVEAAASKDPPK